MRIVYQFRLRIGLMLLAVLIASASIGACGRIDSGNDADVSRPSIAQSGNEPAPENTSKLRSAAAERSPAGMPAATLNIHTFMCDLDADPGTGKGAALGAGVRIKVNGALVGVTDATGSLSIPVTPGALSIAARIGTATASATRSIEPGQVLDVDLLLNFESEGLESTLAADEIRGQLLDAGFKSLTLRFTWEEGQVAVKRVDSIDLLDQDGRAIGMLDDDFAVDQGLIRATNIEHLRSRFLSEYGAIGLHVMVSDEAGLVFQETISFFLARFRVSGTLMAPPSFTGLNTAGVVVNLKLLGTPIDVPVTLTTTSGANGAFTFPGVPLAVVSLDASTQQQGRLYSGQAMFGLTRNASVAVVMRSKEDDIFRGVTPFTLDDAPAGADIPPDVEAIRRTLQKAYCIAEASGEIHSTSAACSDPSTFSD